MFSFQLVRVAPDLVRSSSWRLQVMGSNASGMSYNKCPNILFNATLSSEKFRREGVKRGRSRSGSRPMLRWFVRTNSPHTKSVGKTHRHVAVNHRELE